MDMSPTSAQVDTLTQYRGNQWQQAINAELQDLITAASEMRALISNAKTQTKKKYYAKKFKKLQQQVFQALVAKQRIDGKMSSDTTHEFNFPEVLAEVESTSTSKIPSIVADQYNPVVFS